MDIASIGFAADTSGLDSAAASLQKIVPAAKAAETAAENVSEALLDTSAAAQKVVDASKGAAAQTSATAKVIDTATGAINKQTDALNKQSVAQDNVSRKANPKSSTTPTGAAAAPPNVIPPTGPVDAYGQSLDALRARYVPLYAAGQQYKATLTDINNALKIGALTQDEANEAITNTKLGFVQQVEAIKGTNAQYVLFNSAAKNAAGATDNLSNSHKGLSTQAMAAQHSIRSMVEGLASGMPPSMVLTQQLNHLSYAASGPGGIKQAFSDAIGMFAKFISGTTLIVGGIVAVIGGFALMAASVIKSELALDDLSKSTDTTIADLHGLQQAMSLKGVAPDDFTKAMEAISSGVLDATHNMGSLNSLFIANGVTVKGNVASLAAVADLVAQTASGVQKRNILEAAGLPTTAAFVKFMSQGGDAIKTAINNSVDFNDAAEKNLINKAHDFDDAWNKATTNVANYFKSIVIDNLDWVTKVGQIIDLAVKLHALTATATSPVLPTQPKASTDPTSKQFIGPSAPLGSTDPTSGQFIGPQSNVKKAADPQTAAQAQKANSDAQARISILGDLSTVEQQATAKQLELNAAGLNGVGVNSQMQAKIVLATTAQAEQNRVNQQATAGIFNMQSAQKAASDTLQHWIDQGLVDKNNADQMAAAHVVLARNIQNTADAAAVAAAPLQQLKQLELDGGNLAKSLDTATTGALNNLVQPIQDMMNGVTGLSAGFANLGVVVLQAIQQMIIKMLIITPIAKALQAVMGGLFGGGGSILSIFGIGSNATDGIGGAGPTAPKANALGGVYTSPSLSAYSGQVVSSPTLFKFASGAGLMGEAGPEGILPLKRGPSGSLGVQMYGNQSSSNDNSATHVTYAPNYTLGGTATQKDLDDLKASQQQAEREFSGKVLNTVKTMRKHNVRV